MVAREDAFAKRKLHDVVVVGAGIHGASIACEAASRGLSTLLIQAGNIAGTGSCAPSILVGAELNKLEQCQLGGLITNSKELARLHTQAPHLFRPIPTYIVDQPEVRSKYKVGLETHICQLVQKCQHAKASTTQGPDTDFLSTFNASILNNSAVLGYSVSHIRVVIALLQQLKCLDAMTLLHHRLSAARRREKQWELDIQDINSGETLRLQGKILINCTGCFTNEFLGETIGVKTRSSANTCVTGQLFAEMPQSWKTAVMLQHPNKSLIGVHSIDTRHLCIGPIFAKDKSPDSEGQAIDEFVSLWNQKANTPLSKDRIIFCHWSDQPVLEDPSITLEKHVQESFLDLNNPGHAAPLLSLFGINLVQYRRLAEQALDILHPFTDAKKNPEFAGQALPGGDFEGQTLNRVLTQLTNHYDFLPHSMVKRLLFTYGTNALQILDNAHREDDLGRHFGGGLYQREVDYLRCHEWAASADDILWRRTFLGLNFSEAHKQILNEYLNSAQAEFSEIT